MPWEFSVEKTSRLKISDTESKVSDKNNISLEEKKQLTEVVHMKKVRSNTKLTRCVGENGHRKVIQNL